MRLQQPCTPSHTRKGRCYRQDRNTAHTVRISIDPSFIGALHNFSMPTQEKQQNDQERKGGTGTRPVRVFTLIHTHRSYSGAPRGAAGAQRSQVLKSTVLYADQHMQKLASWGNFQPRRCRDNRCAHDQTKTWWGYLPVIYEGVIHLQICLLCRFLLGEADECVVQAVTSFLVSYDVARDHLAKPGKDRF